MCFIREARISFFAICQPGGLATARANIVDGGATLTLQ